MTVFTQTPCRVIHHAMQTWKNTRIQYKNISKNCLLENFLILVQMRTIASEIYWPLISQIIYHTVKNLLHGLSLSPEFDLQCERNYSEHNDY